MPYEVSTPVFEGPFDLLLHLIVAQQVDLYEVPLHAIVDAYLAELDRMREAAVELDLDVATEFLLIAATLVELKARRLLPGVGDGDTDEELSVWEERDLLLSRLVECKTFKDAGAALAAMAAEAGRSVPRRVGLEPRFVGLVPDLLAGVTPADLRRAALRALTPRPTPRVTVDHVVDVRASVSDALAELALTLPRIGRATFRQLTAGLPGRLDVIVRFLALLELYKEGLVDLGQAAAFGELQVTWTGAGAGARVDGGHESALRVLADVDAYDG